MTMVCTTDDGLELDIGDTEILDVEDLLDEDGQPASFGAGDILYWTAKRFYGLPDSMALVQKTSSDGGIVIGTNDAEVLLLPADTARMQTARRTIRFVWDHELIRAGDPLDVVTLNKGE